jgi:hypothetical protein
MQRQQSTPHTFEDRLATERAKLEKQAVKLKPGAQLEAIRAKIRQLDTAADISEWLASPGLHPPI